MPPLNSAMLPDYHQAVVDLRLLSICQTSTLDLTEAVEKYYRITGI